jgi:hypothetical protein
MLSNVVLSSLKYQVLNYSDRTTRIHVYFSVVKSSDYSIEPLVAALIKQLSFEVERFCKTLEGQRWIGSLKGSGKIESL